MITVWLLGYALAMVVHECGHLLAARLAGVKVDRLFIGLDVGGRALVRMTVRGTTVGIGWLPLGSYIRLRGMFPEDGSDPGTDDIRRKANWVKALVVIAGPVANGLAALMLHLCYEGPNGAPLIALNLWLGAWCSLPLKNSDGHLFLMALRGVLFSPRPTEPTSQHVQGSGHIG